MTPLFHRHILSGSFVVCRNEVTRTEASKGSPGVNVPTDAVLCGKMIKHDGEQTESCSSADCVPSEGGRGQFMLSLPNTSSVI